MCVIHISTAIVYLIMHGNHRVWFGVFVPMYSIIIFYNILRFLISTPLLCTQVLMASEHFIPSKFVILADYAPIVKNFPMLAALAEACLWPVVLLLFDDQFVPRLSNLYRRRSASERAKPPQGKYCHYHELSRIRPKRTESRLELLW